MRLNQIAKIAAAAALIAATTACTKREVKELPADQAKWRQSLVESEVTFLDKYFEGEHIDTVKVDDNDGITTVTLRNGVEIDFEFDGDWRKVHLHKNEAPQQILDILPIKARTYLKTEANDQAVRRMYHNIHGYKVATQGGNIYHFTRSGRFTPNDARRLPSNVKVLLSKAFAGDSIVSATRDEDYMYEVELASGCDVTFDRMGRFEKADAPRGEAFPETFMAQLPQQLTRYIAANHPGKKVSKVIRKNYGYYVKFAKPHSSTALRFSKKGDYLKQANASEDE